MQSLEYEVQQSWTVAGKTFPSREAAEAHSTQRKRQDQAAKVLKEAIDSATEKDGINRIPFNKYNSPTMLARVIAEHPVAFRQALQIIEGGES